MNITADGFQGQTIDEHQHHAAGRHAASPSRSIARRAKAPRRRSSSPAAASRVTQLATSARAPASAASPRTRRASTATSATSSASIRASASTATTAARARTASPASAATIAATPSPSTASARATSTASTTPASRRAARPRFPMTRSARRRSSSRRSTSSTASSPAARSTSSPSRAPTSSTAARFFEYSDNGMRGDTCRRAVPVAPIEPDKRWGVYLGGPIIPDRLFFFGAYEHQEAGQIAGRRPDRRRLSEPDQRASRVAQFNEISDILRTQSTASIPARWSPTVRSPTTAISAALDWQINDDHRLELTYQRLEESTVRADDFFTGPAAPQITGEQHLLHQRHQAPNYYSGRLYSQWTDKFSTELRYSRSEVRTCRTRSAAARRSRTTRSRASSSASTIPAARRRRRSWPAPAPRARPTICRPTIEQYRALGEPGGGRSQPQARLRMESGADLFNLFVQNATGTLVFRNIADLASRPAVAGHRQQPDEHLPRSTSSAGRPRAHSAISAPPATSTMRRRAFSRSIFSVYLAGRLAVNDRSNVVVGVRVDWYDGGRSGAEPALPARYGFSNATGFNDLDPVILPRVGVDLATSTISGRVQPRRNCAAASASSPAAIRWCGSATPSRTTAAASPRAPPRMPPARCPAGAARRGHRTASSPAFRPASGRRPRRLPPQGLGDTQSIDPDIQQPTVFRANLGFSAELELHRSGFFSGWDFNLDYIYSQLLQPVHDRRSVADHRDHRQRRRRPQRLHHRRPARSTVAIDPTIAGCTAQLVDRGRAAGLRQRHRARASTPPATTS